MKREKKVVWNIEVWNGSDWQVLDEDHYYTFPDEAAANEWFQDMVALGGAPIRLVQAEL